MKYGILSPAGREQCPTLLLCEFSQKSKHLKIRNQIKINSIFIHWSCFPETFSEMLMIMLFKIIDKWKYLNKYDWFFEENTSYVLIHGLWTNCCNVFVRVLPWTFHLSHLLPASHQQEVQEAGLKMTFSIFSLSRVSVTINCLQGGSSFKRSCRGRPPGMESLVSVSVKNFNNATFELF